MKKHLLFLGTLLSAPLLFGQFTDANEPEINDGITLFVIDSSASNYDAINGAGVTWDYSGYLGYGGEDRNLTVLDPASTPSGSEYPNSSKAITIDNFLTTYFDSDNNKRTGQGFVFNEPSIGDVVIVYDNSVDLYDYPFDYGDEIENSNVTGSVETSAAPVALPPFEGEANYTVDGTGTLLLANGVTYNDVIRYKVEEDFLIEDAPFVGDVDVERTQYEYYSLDDQELPIFVHSTIITSLQPDPITLVMSIEDPSDELSVNTLSKDLVSIFPNPTENILNINLENSAEAVVTISDALGKVVYNKVLNQQDNMINTTDFTNGVYFVNVQQNNQVYTKKVIKK